jgi:hypothetical protein
VKPALALVAIALSAGAAAAPIPCITCRTERCPTKEGVAAWCGAGADPTAKKEHKPKVAACPTGQVANGDTRGHCCWPGQAWSHERKACVGAPSACPTGMVANVNDCVGNVAAPAPLPVGKATCTPGKQVSADTAGHCCWPGQAWARDRCVGIPTACPEGFRAQGEACALAPCEGGRVRADDGVHCCWPGQAWAASRAACVGVPSRCPPDAEVVGEECRAVARAPLPAPTPPRDDRADARQRFLRALARVKAGAEGALDELDAALADVRDATSVYQAGMGCRMEKQTRCSVLCFRRYLRLAPDASNSTEVRAMIAEAEAQLRAGFE